MSRHKGFGEAVQDGHKRWRKRQEAVNKNDLDDPSYRFIDDIHDSEAWDYTMEQEGMKDSHRNLIFSLCTDSADLHSYGRSAKIKPLLLTLLNMRRNIRCRAE